MAFRRPEHSCGSFLSCRWSQQILVLKSKVDFPPSYCSFHLLSCYYNKDLASLAAQPQGSPYLPAENADFISEVETGRKAMGKQGDKQSRNLAAATRNSRASKHPGNVVTVARGFFVFKKVGRTTLKQCAQEGDGNSRSREAPSRSTKNELREDGLKHGRKHTLAVSDSPKFCYTYKKKNLFVRVFRQGLLVPTEKWSMHNLHSYKGKE